MGLLARTLLQIASGARRHCSRLPLGLPPGSVRTALIIHSVAEVGSGVNTVGCRPVFRRVAGDASIVWVFGSAGNETSVEDGIQVRSRVFRDRLAIRLSLMQDKNGSPDPTSGGLGVQVDDVPHAMYHHASR